MSRRLRAAVALASACAFAAACAAAVAAAGAPSAVPNCLGKPVVRPSQVILACADAGLGLERLTWVGWGSPIAAGIGTAFANDCTPTCAAGHFHDYRAVLLLSGNQPCEGRRVYKTATVAIVGTPPATWATASDATYPLRCA